MRSQGGNPEACIIDCQGSPTDNHRGFLFVNSEGPDATLEGVTVANGYMEIPEVGGGISCSGGDPTIVNCILVGNTAYEGGGLNNTSAANVTVIGCIFAGNSSQAGGGMASASGSAPTITDCTFYGNRGGVFGGGVSFVWSIAVVSGCTFYGNTAPDGSGIHSGYGSVVEAHNCIIAGNIQGPGFGCGSMVDPTLTCCDVHGNEGGDWIGCIASQYGINGNISEDPLFCDPEAGDFTLDFISVCAAENNPECGQIGAWGIGCGGTPVAPSTWGGIKTLFRK